MSELLHRLRPRYGKLILRSLSTLPHPRGMQSVALPTGQSDTGERGQYAVQEELSGYVLYRGRPGKDCGHTSEEASSYFDRYFSLLSSGSISYINSTFAL